MGTCPRTSYRCHTKAVSEADMGKPDLRMLPIPGRAPPLSPTEVGRERERRGVEPGSRNV